MQESRIKEIEEAIEVLDFRWGLAGDVMQSLHDNVEWLMEEVKRLTKITLLHEHKCCAAPEGHS